MLYRRIVKHQDQQFGLILSSHIFVFDVSIDWNKKGCWSIQLQFKAFEIETARMTLLSHESNMAYFMPKYYFSMEYAVL